MGAFAAATFDTIVFQEDRKLRGRAPASIVAPLRQGALSAGASAMSETMLVKGRDASSFRLEKAHMALGLGLLPNVTIDQHLAERDASGVTYSDVAEGKANSIASIYDIKLHVLSEGLVLDLTTRRPAGAQKHDQTPA